MNCPNCDDQKLDERHSHGIEIDVCPKCGGVWLDRGELEKLVGSSGQDEPTLLATSSHDEAQDGSTAPSTADYRDSDNDDNRDDDDDDRREGKPKKKKRQESQWERLADALEEIFEDVLDLDIDFD